MQELLINTVGSTGAGNRLLVLVHGYGADENDLAPLTPHIDPDGRFFTICPRGPQSVMGFGAGWYERDDDGNIDPAMFLASVDALDATIDAACATHGFDRAQSVIIGFSQGGAMTLASSLRSEGATRPAAAACLSGMMQEVDGLRYVFEGVDVHGGEAQGVEAQGGDMDGGDLPALLIHHGTLDPLVTIDRGHKIRDTLTAHGVDHVYREYPMQHEISPRSVQDLAGWLASVPDSTP